MKHTKDYGKTKIACYLGFVTQAIVANFTPLLFMAFHREYEIPIARMALIPAVFYIVQLVGWNIGAISCRILYKFYRE